MNKKDLIHQCFMDAPTYDLTDVVRIFERNKSLLYHQQGRFLETYYEIVLKLAEMGVPEYVMEGVHLMLKEEMGDLYSIVSMTKGKYLRGILDFYKCLYTLKINVIDNTNPDYDMIKIILDDEKK